MGTCNPSAIGRFLTPDPAGMVDGPNLYAYVLNDPINFTDPSGLTRSCNDAGSVTEGPTGEFTGCVSPGGGGGGGFFLFPINLDFGGGGGGRIGGGGGGSRGGPGPDPESQPIDPADADRAVLCALPPIGFGAGIEAFAAVGGGVQFGGSVDIPNGRFSLFLSLGLGVGVGGGVFGFGAINAPSGLSANFGLGGALGFGGAGVQGSRSVLGTGAGSASVGVARVGPQLGVNATGIAEVSIGTPRLFDIGCPQ